MILLVLWSANGDCSALTSKVNLLNGDTYRWGCATVKLGHPLDNGARCALYKEILDLLDEEMFLEHTVVELVYKVDEKSTANV